MKIYEYSYSDWNNRVLERVLDAEEKPKSYIYNGISSKKRINKSEIGTVNAYGNIYLLEADRKKAIDLICEKLSTDISHENLAIEYSKGKIKRMEESIKKLKEELENE